MTSGFLENVPSRSSYLAKREARAKLLLVLGAIIAIASEPPGELSRFPVYVLLIAALVVAGKIGVRVLGVRLLAATPFLLAAATAPLLSSWMGDGLDVRGLGLSLIFRAAAAITLLTVLLETTAADELLTAMRRLRAPSVVSAVVVLTYRYLFLLFEEWRRMGSARACRAAGRLNVPRANFYAKQFALVFLRAWERAERVESAMEVRGFNGELPVRSRSPLTAGDWALAALGVSAFWAVRLLLN